MNIRILQNSGRRCAWTDRKNGYFEFLCAADVKNSGYYRETKRYCKGFAAAGHACNEAKYIDVYPQGFSACYDNVKLNVSLLVDEQAFFISGTKNPGILGIVPFYEKEKQDKAENLAFLQENDPENEAASASAPAVSEKKTPSAVIPPVFEWKMVSSGGITVLSSNTGIAVAAPFDFYFKINDDILELYALDESLFPKKNMKDEFVPDENGWYVVFEADEKTASEKALCLAKTGAIYTHCKTVQAFLDKCSFRSGDAKFDESVQWARFSAWMLATMDHDSSYRGIWAGLPWFRDNWGRDTFISLCGTLLVSGCFDEARDVLLGFAGFQDLNRESPTYGRIPNRYRNADDVIYNTADGTLWFIRALWEYVQYSGDVEIIEKLKATVETALDADIQRTDKRGFLTHGDADTWMDARIRGNEPWSPRGNRANDIQALWFTALKLGAYFMEKCGDEQKAAQYNSLAETVRESFRTYFWSADNDALADHLLEGEYGEWAKDMRVRPNQLFAITVPQILPGAYNEGKSNFIEETAAASVMKNVERELVSPFGLFSLSTEDPLFHPDHENPEFYNKDAAYHNGTIWEWNSGAYISASALYSKGTLPQKAGAILQNESKMIMDFGCAGSLSENIHARPDSDGNPVLSGTFSQAWSVAEFARNICQDVIGFVPRLAENKISLRPCLPSGCKEFGAVLPFGRGWSLEINVIRKNRQYDCTAVWHLNGNADALPELLINDVPLCPEETAHIFVRAEKVSSVEKFGCPAKWVKAPFAARTFVKGWTGSVHMKDYLEKLILSGRMKSKTCAGENTAALEWYFDCDEFKKNYLTDVELGSLYSRNSTVFRLWAPTAQSVSVILYPDGNGSSAEKIIEMHRMKDENAGGVWEAVVSGDLHGTYYEYGLYVHGVYNHSADPYARSCGVNGIRSMVIDMKRTNPDGWENVRLPSVETPCDAVVYEAHIADLTSSPSWNGSEEKRRLYTGAVEPGTSFDGVPTGFDHIKKLGVTHVQLLPVFDFSTVDEANMHNEEYRKRPVFGTFNWGYDPQNYGVPEGSYSSDPFNGEVRIKEFKQMIKSFADSGIGIVMDVVFNHVNNGLHQALGVCVPGYFFRVEGYSGAGEDTASEREMFRKYMIDTLSFWLSEYKLCGFRFDLMGLHDVKTMNEIDKALHKIKKDVLIYGEGWDMYRAGKMESACQKNASKMPGIGHFNDAVRCAIKGPVFDDKEPGFIHNGNRREAVKFGIVGATAHPQVDNKKVEGTGNPEPWGKTTWTSVNYTEIHDNMTLNDKIRLVEENKPEAYYEQLVKMALSLVILSEGMPALHAGMEFMRTKEIPQELLDCGATFYDVAKSSDGKKSYFRNSYNVCDKVNGLDWQRCALKQDVVCYVQKLIALRKNHPVFRIADAKTVEENLVFIDNRKEGLPEEVLGWKISGAHTGDSWKNAVIIANPLNMDVKYKLPEDEKWSPVTDGIKFFGGEGGTAEGGTVVCLKPKTVSVFAAE